MPTIQSVRERRDRCTMAWGVDDVIELEYWALKAAAISQEDMQQLREDAIGKTEDEQRRVLAAFLINLLYAWNVYEWEKRDDDGAIIEHGPMIPVDVDAIAAFHDDFIAACAAAIIEHVNVGKVTGLPLSAHGIATTSPMDGDKSSPDGKDADSLPSVSLSKSPSKAAQPRGSSKRIQSGSPSIPPAFRRATAS